VNFIKLSPPERIQIIQELMAVLIEKDEIDIDLYFSEFKIGNLNSDWVSLKAGTQNSLQATSDEILTNIHKFLIGGVTTSIDSFNTWKESGVRLFMSHSSGKKVFVTQVSEKLKELGIQSFVAHDDIQSGTTWFEAMTSAIRSCDVFVAFIHDDFKSREWCDHELGFALGMNLQPLLLNFGHAPYGFLKQLQNEMVKDKNEYEISEIIFNWLIDNPNYVGLLEDSMVQKFILSNNFVSTRELYWKIDSFRSISSQNYEKIARAFKTNDQVYKYGGFNFTNGECTWLSSLRNKTRST